MAKPRYECCEIAEIRSRIEQQLPKLRAGKSKDESPAEFWSRVERTGLLIEALVLYDKITAEHVALKHLRRETKKAFEQRMQREGRQVEAERFRAELLATGLSQRQTQVALVERLQPLDGTRTRAWETPDPWQAGRLFKSKADQDRVLELTQDEENDDEDGSRSDAENRLNWAQRRRDERQALADARRRAWSLKREQKKSSRRSERTYSAKSFTEEVPDKASVRAQGEEDRLVL
jgi:hypothetical protein